MYVYGNGTIYKYINGTKYKYKWNGTIHTLLAFKIYCEHRELYINLYRSISSF